MAENENTEQKVAEKVKDNSTDVPATLDETDVAFELLWGYEDEDGNIHKEVELREMTGEEEEAISDPKVRDNLGRVITTLLEQCILRIGDFKKEDYISSNPGRKKWNEIMLNLFIGDREYTMLQIVRATHGDEMEFETQCQNRRCNEPVIVSFNYDELNIEPVKCENPKEIPFELEKGYKDKKSGNRVKKGVLTLPNGFIQEQLDKEARRNAGVANTSLLNACVKQLGNITLTPNVFRKMSLSDRRVLADLIAENTFGPDLRIPVECNMCGREFEAGVNPVNFI